MATPDALVHSCSRDGEVSGATHRDAHDGGECPGWSAGVSTVRGREPVRGLLVGGLGALLTVGLAGSSLAAPPPNPSDSDIDGQRAEVDANAARVGRLTGRLAEVEARLDAVLTEVALRREDASRAQVDLDRARWRHQEAEDRAAEAAEAARDVGDRLAALRTDMDSFASESYQGGGAVNSLGAYLGASSPKDLLDRAQYLDAVGESHQAAMEELQHVSTDKANKDAAARDTLREARASADAALEAERAADTAYRAAREAEDEQRSLAAEIEREREEVQEELDAARDRVDGLERQRRQYERWRQEEDDRLAALQVNPQQVDPGALAPGETHPAPSLPAPPADADAAIETVVRRALAQVGVPYSWGGGNANGPTLGVRDGGVADTHGDYRKVGFDCSGLMLYAYAGIGVAIPKYSGYQYEAGRRVPLAEKRRGDLVFWATGGRIYHVALYLGDGLIVEAPYSGGHVRVTPMRYGGVVPHAVRLV